MRQLLPAGTRRTRRTVGALTVSLCGLALVAGILLISPLVALVVRAPWSQLGAAVTSPEARAALRLSVIASLAALALSTAIGMPLAWAFARLDFPGKALARALCVLPMVLPPVVGGVALLLAFGRRGLIGQPLDELTGITLPFGLGAVVLAETFVAMPFLVVTVEAGLRAMDRRYEDVAATLGAGRWMAFRRVTLPLVAPSLIAGMALCWARALGEFGATITFAGNLSGRTQTMPLAVYIELERDLGVAILLSLILTVVSVIVLVSLRERFLSTA
ncbi:MAG: ABC transporter permease [Egibacteraceae bacterium]